MLSVASPGAETGARTSWQLPVELLLQCLMTSDMVARIRASHVCRTWREVALAERRLWNSFSCTEFRDKQHEDAMFSLLGALLLRSLTLPFHLEIPHLHDRTDYEYRDRLLRVEGFDISRLAAYHGPIRLFEQLNPDREPLPALLCLDVLNFYGGQPDTAVVDMNGILDSRCVPNLQQLIAPSVLFPADCGPLLAMQSITFACMRQVYHRALFAYCPRLVRMDIADSIMGAPLPDPPLPTSLEEVTICCSRPRAVDFAALMRGWRGVRIRRVIARELYSMQDVLPLFLASHMHMVEMRLPCGSDDVALSAIPDNESISNTLWTLSPSPAWAADFLASMESPISERLTSVCVSLSRLGALLSAQLHAPGLETLEFLLDSAADAIVPPLQTGDQFFLCAPRLRNVFFTLSEDSNDSLENTLAVLRTSFRQLLLYDAELLDCIASSHRAERICAGFAPFTKDYVLANGRL